MKYKKLIWLLIKKCIFYPRFFDQEVLFFDSEDMISLDDTVKGTLTFTNFGGKTLYINLKYGEHECYET